MPLTAQQIEKAKPRTMTVPVPELEGVDDGQILLAAMPAPQLCEFLKSIRDEEETRDNLDLTYMYEFLAACIADPETLRPLFTAETISDSGVGRLSMESMQDLFKAAYDLHGISQDTSEELKKNLETIPVASSGGNSPGSGDMPTSTNC